MNIDKFLNNIKKLQMDGKHKEPSFKLFVTNSDQIYKAKEDVYVIPHVLLRP